MGKIPPPLRRAMTALIIERMEKYPNYKKKILKKMEELKAKKKQEQNTDNNQKEE
ncbi:MAG: hypothetical protein OIF50_01965 [Flavobacteriaceae bacterium]|nr:hypothetical protein [Flavobacteriaceae bacterium]